MSLLDRLNDDMKQAMRDKDKQKLSVIRMTKAALQNESINSGLPLTEDDELTILSREVKQRKESLHEFEQAGRGDLVEKINHELAILKQYMPEQLTEEEVVEIVKKAIADVQASSKSDMGKVMSAVMPKVKGKADGSLVNKLVSEHLS
ncbi:GatB/YqeY domain-containing protein [Priestia endophytica]|uniref:GatB/YqeY domain-containing protein n=1 Tax=Priestia endophytica TaxID=135735 RepID=UPI002E239A9A|nr:GatB/YqeY domain-containing protein [Priestia endophytica]